MQFTTTRDKLFNTLIRVSRAITKNSSLPVLSCILIEVKNGLVILRASNLDIGIEGSVAAQTFSDGTIAIPGSEFLALVSSCMENGKVDIVSDGPSVTIKSGNRVTKLKAVIHEDFPIIPKINKGKPVSIPSIKIVDGLKSVYYSVSNSSVKPELSSIFVYTDGDTIKFAATDGFRLAEKSFRFNNTGLFGAILIPQKSALDLVKILDGLNEDVFILTDGHHMSLECGNIFISARLTDGVFPDYKQIIPSKYKTEAVVLKQDLMSALKIVSVFSDSFYQIKNRIFPDKGIFCIETLNKNIGEYKENIQAALSGDSLEIKFNHRYISDCFQSINSDSVFLNFAGEGKPVLIGGVGDGSFRYIVMPMRG